MSRRAGQARMRLVAVRLPADLLARVDETEAGARRLFGDDRRLLASTVRCLLTAALDHADAAVARRRGGERQDVTRGGGR